MFHLTSVPVLLDVDVIYCTSIVLLTPHGSFGIVPLLHSARDVSGDHASPFNRQHISGLVPVDGLWWNLVWTSCHWSPPRNSTFQFHTSGNKNVADMLICEAGATLATLAQCCRRVHVDKTSKLFILISFVQQKYSILLKHEVHCDAEGV